MNIPEWLKPGAYGVAVGAVAAIIGGFSWGGWQTAAGARDMAKTMSDESVVAALVPVCLEMSRNDIERTEKISKIREVASYRRREAVMATGWATMPGADGPDRGLASACAAALDLGES